MYLRVYLQAIKRDVIRSLLSRVELLCEDFATNEEEQCRSFYESLNLRTINIQKECVVIQYAPYYSNKFPLFWMADCFCSIKVRGRAIRDQCPVLANRDHSGDHCTQVTKDCR